MITDEFGRLALAMPGVVEGDHNKHPRFSRRRENLRDARLSRLAMGDGEA